MPPNVGPQLQINPQRRKEETQSGSVAQGAGSAVFFTVAAPGAGYRWRLMKLVALSDTTAQRTIGIKPGGSGSLKYVVAVRAAAAPPNPLPDDGFPLAENQSFTVEIDSTALSASTTAWVTINYVKELMPVGLS